MEKLGHNTNSIADTASNVEPNTSNAPNGEEVIEGCDTPCSIHIHSIRHRLADIDGISVKACIDGLVHAKVLQDDSPKYVKEVTFSQEKSDVEKTIITIKKIIEK
jgi:hypothetical protein